MKIFNVAGPCNPKKHYMIDASTRLEGVEQLIEEELYFIIHAARQSGKTTYLMDLANKLNAEGKYYVLYCSLESLQEFKEMEKGIPEIVKLLKRVLMFNNIPNAKNFAEDVDYTHISGVLNASLTFFCMKLDKPLVILFDEADCLSAETLITFLRQLREGYVSRINIPFVHSIALVGMRNIRDFKAKVRDDRETLGSASPFNVITKTMTLKNFTKQEITSLYQQHTDETGQIFESEAIDYIFEQTCGQPWLVNAIAREIIVEMLKSDYSQSITAEMVKTAIQTIILRRDTHIDSLLERLKEERVRKVIEPMIIGELFTDRLLDDYQYVTDLGLIKDINGKIEPSNPIYAEVIIRTLSYDAQKNIISEKPDYTVPRYLKDSKIDINHLLTDFQQFWRENSTIWTDKIQYKEAAPHLILQAFLQRILNGGGYIRREMAAGTGRLDLGVVYENKIYPIEVKLWKGAKYYKEGLDQTARYIDTYGCKEGWLVIFDQGKRKSWKEKIYLKQEKIDGIVINVFGI